MAQSNGVGYPPEKGLRVCIPGLSTKIEVRKAIRFPALVQKLKTEICKKKPSERSPRRCPIFAACSGRSDAIMSAREKAHKLYMASFGFTDSVLNASNGRTGESTHAIKLFEARIGTLRSRLEVALTMVLQQLFPEYAMTDTRLQMKRPKELQQDGLGQVLSAHQAGLLPQAEAAALVHHQLGGVCHPQDEGDEKDEQPAEVAAAAGEDARSEAESSRSSKSVTSLVSSGS